MKTIMQRIWKRENLVALLLIVTAILSLFEIPQILGITETKIILIMLGFLAVDGLIEKVGYLDEAEKRIKHIENVIMPHPNSILLQNRRSLPSFLDLISGVKNVFIFAMSANNLVTNEYRTIENALIRGVNFRFVLISPDNLVLQVAPHSSPSAAALDDQVQWIQSTFEMLEKLSHIEKKGRLELRLFHGIPTTSLVAYDIEKENGWVQVEPHIYRQTPADRPLFVLQIGSKNEWIHYYRKVVAEIWAASTESHIKI